MDFNKYVKGLFETYDILNFRQEHLDQTTRSVFIKQAECHWMKIVLSLAKQGLIPKPRNQQVAKLAFPTTHPITHSTSRRRSRHASYPTSRSESQSTSHLSYRHVERRSIRSIFVLNRSISWTLFGHKQRIWNILQRPHNWTCVPYFYFVTELYYSRKIKPN